MKTTLRVILLLLMCFGLQLVVFGREADDTAPLPWETVSRAQCRSKCFDRVGVLYTF